MKAGRRQVVLLFFRWARFSPEWPLSPCFHSHSGGAIWERTRRLLHISSGLEFEMLANALGSFGDKIQDTGMRLQCNFQGCCCAQIFVLPEVA